MKSSPVAFILIVICKQTSFIHYGKEIKVFVFFVVLQKLISKIQTVILLKHDAEGVG